MIQPIFSKYKTLKEKIQRVVLSDEAALFYLESLCRNKIQDNKSLAKIVNQFNSRIRNRNIKLANQVRDCLEKKSPWSSLDLEPRVLKKIEKKITNPRIQKKVESLRGKLREVEETVVKEYYSLAIYLAKKNSSKTFGIEINDIIQEATQAILRALEKYDVDFRNKKGEPVQFISYAYTMINERIKTYIMNQSRTIRLPESKLKRLFTVIEASNEISSRNSTALATKANQILKNRLERKLSKNEIFTEEEIEDLILSMSNPISLDRLKDSPGNRSLSLKEVIIDKETLSPLDSLEKKNARAEILQSLKDLLTGQEYEVIYYKFFSEEDEVTLEDVQEKLRNQGIDYSKEWINRFKKSALEKIKRRKDLVVKLGGI